MDCLFCKIIAGEIPSAKVYEDEYVYAFKDISPIAPVHYLIVPKMHICCANAITADNSAAVAKVFEAAARIAAQENIESYRIINNCGEDAGQTVMHLHFHMLAGVKMGWGEQSLG
jgi:histidine triad (HIT) family protein